MRTSLTTDATPRPVSAPDTKPIDELLRTIVTRATAAAGGAAADDPEDHEIVLLDAEVDGARYLLVRMPASVRARVALSPREQEIVRMVAQGHPNKVIADVLNISSWTVGTHLRRIFAKLGVGSRAAMVARLSVDRSSDPDGATRKMRLPR